MANCAHASRGGPLHDALVPPLLRARRRRHARIHRRANRGIPLSGHGTGACVDHMTGSPLPALDDQRRYWDERWDRQRLPNDYQRRRGDRVLAILRSLRLTHPEILDFGCGTGWFTADLPHWGRATGIDLSETAIAYAQATYPHVPFIAANLFETPFSGGQFDVVVSQEVVAHVQD